MKFEVKNRFTGAVQFTAEIDCDDCEKMSVKLGLAVMWAIKNNTDLRYSNLRGTDLHSTDLRGTDLRGTDLRYSNLSGTDLSGTDLRGTDLRYSNLSGTDLRGTDLRGTDLRYSNLSGTDLRYSNLLVFQGLGSEARTLYAHRRKDGVIEIRTGCFFGTMPEFKEAVVQKHGNNNHAKDYELMCQLIEQKFGAK